MKISVITVCYNSASTVQATLSSIDDQDHNDIEHVIVDGASQDTTLELIARHPKSWRHVVSEQDNGIYDAMNKGFDIATGDVIGFLNSDDMYATNFIVSEIARIFEDPDVDACYADLVYVDQETGRRTIRNWRSSPYSKGLFKKAWVPPHPTFYVRRSVYQRYGGFNTRFTLAADYLFMLRLLEVEGINSVYIPKIWVKMRTGGASNKSINNVIRQNIEIYNCFRLLGMRYNVFLFLLRKIWIRFNQFMLR